jgi:hypothetical protein
MASLFMLTSPVSGEATSTTAGLGEDLGVNLTEVQAYFVDRACEIEWACVVPDGG